MTSPARRAIRTALLIAGASGALLLSGGTAVAETPPLPGPTPNHDVCLVWRGAQPATARSGEPGSYCIEYWSPV